MNLYLNPEECKFLATAVVGTLELVERYATSETIPWTPEVRKMNKDMLNAGKGLKLKLQKLGFDMSPLPPYFYGDEDEFLTKQS